MRCLVRFARSILTPASAYVMVAGLEGSGATKSVRLINAYKKCGELPVWLVPRKQRETRVIVARQKQHWRASADRDANDREGKYTSARTCRSEPTRGGAAD